MHQYWSFSFRISPSNEYSGLISFRSDWLDLLAVHGSLESSPTPQSKALILWRSASLWSDFLPYGYTQEEFSSFVHVGCAECWHHTQDRAPPSPRRSLHAPLESIFSTRPLGKQNNFAFWRMSHGIILVIVFNIHLFICHQVFACGLQTGCGLWDVVP